jgi:NADH-quinone oxidoreductase subunit N
MNVVPFNPSMLLALLPELLLILLGGLVMAADLAWPEARKRGLGLLTATGFGVVLVATLVFAAPSAEPALIFGGMLRHDLAAFAFRILFLFAGAVTALISLDSPGVGQAGEYYVIMIASVIGMNLMAAAGDLVMLYLALETTSITQYVLAGFLRDDNKSAESGLKYFLFGAFTSTIMLYGFSLLYGFTGQTNLYALGPALVNGGLASSPAVALALVLILVGFGFKVSAFPLHFWSPDVYEGAPTPVTAFLSVASKSAGFAVLVRVLLAAFPAMGDLWTPLITAMAVLTMTIGNALALAQKNIKRLLAYSSIAQAGYVLVGLAAAGVGLNTERGVASILYYLGTYTLTNLAAFGVIVLTARVVGSDEIADYAGLSRRSPGLAMALLIAFLSLGGMPPLAGFFGKFFVFSAAVESNLVWLAIVGVINAIVGLYYYLTFLKVVYLYRSERDSEPVPVARAYQVALWVCAAGVILLGTWIAPWVGISNAVAATLF